MEFLIQKYLKENNAEGKNGVDYRLENSGDGIEIKDWTLPIEKPSFTQEESILSEKKIEKISLLKLNREAYLLQDYVSHQAIELELDEDDNPSIDGEQVYFKFKCKPTGNPASEPNSILLGVLVASSSSPNYFIRYSCEIIDGQNTRKGYVKINASVASQLMSHVSDRNIGAIKLTNEREAAIEAATTLDQVNAVEITF
jgi:hypothetical protein